MYTFFAVIIIIFFTVDFLCYRWGNIMTMEECSMKDNNFKYDKHGYFFLIIPRLFRLQFWWCVAENLTKSMDWFLYDNGLRHEKVKWLQLFFTLFLIAKYLLFLLAYKNLPILENLKTMSSVNRKYGTWFSTDNLLL